MKTNKVLGYLLECNICHNEKFFPTLSEGVNQQNYICKDCCVARHKEELEFYRQEQEKRNE